MSDVSVSSPSRGHHRSRRAGAAVAVTAGVAASSLAVAMYAASTAAPSVNPDAVRASVGMVDPTLGSSVLGSVNETAGSELGALFEQVRDQRAETSGLALGVSADLAGNSAQSLRSESAAISKKKAEERKARQEAAERAEREAAERAEREAAERAEAEQAAARSSERQQAPKQSEPAPAAAPVNSGDPKSIAQGMLSSYGWGGDQWGCLESLWQRESGWNHTAANPSSGAYGIPQSLPGSKMASAGGDWQTNPATQIEWGLGYIQERYGSPCGAWAHSESVGWY